jgi:ribonuclease HII
MPRIREGTSPSAILQEGPPCQKKVSCRLSGYRQGLSTAITLPAMMVVEWPASSGDEPPPGTTHLVGVDEAGRGPVMGPLVVAALAVPIDGGEGELRELGVRDSKKLQPARRDKMAERLVEYPHRVIEVPAEDIDALRSTASLNVVEARVFASAVLALASDLGGDVRVTAYLDAADSSESMFERYFRSALGDAPGADNVVHVVSRHEADDTFPVVSAASVVAKARREAAVARIREELGTDIGSGYPSDRTTIDFLEKWITEKGVLPPHTRKSWRTAQRLMDRHGSSVRRLDDY